MIREALLRTFIRNIILEQFARNYHTLDNDPYSWEDYPGIDINIYPAANGAQWFAKVTVDFDDSLSTSSRAFATEEEARSYARQHVEKANRERMSKNIMTGTPDLVD